MNEQAKMNLYWTCFFLPRIKYQKLGEMSRVSYFGDNF
jgi:hypothetical protein